MLSPNCVIRWIARQHLYACSFWGWASMVGIPWLIARDLQKMLMDYWQVSMPLWVFLVAGGLAIWAGGWLLFWLGIPGAESEYQCQINPEWKRAHVEQEPTQGK